MEQQTVGWDEAAQATFSQRFKEEAHDYRYFPEPDLPPLVVPEAWVQSVRESLPELPDAKRRRFVSQYGLSEAEAALLGRGKSGRRVLRAGRGIRVGRGPVRRELDHRRAVRPDE